MYIYIAEESFITQNRLPYKIHYTIHIFAHDLQQPREAESFGSDFSR